MIKIMQHRQQPDGTVTKLLILGLSDANITAIRAGKPIYIAGEQIKAEHGVLILHGATEQSIVDVLKARGVIPSDAKPDEPIEG